MNMREKYTVENFESYIYKTAQYLIIKYDLKKTKKAFGLSADLYQIVTSSEWVESFEAQLLTINCCPISEVHNSIVEVQSRWKEELEKMEKNMEAHYLTRISLVILTRYLTQKIKDLLEQ